MHCSILSLYTSCPLLFLLVRANDPLVTRLSLITRQLNKVGNRVLLFFILIDSKNLTRSYKALPASASVNIPLEFFNWNLMKL